MRRREFIALISGAAVLGPSVHVRAQSARKVVAYFAPARTEHLIAAFNKGLSDLGYADGQNITVKYWFANERGETLDTAAAQVVAGGPDVIVVVGVAATTLLKQATAVIPIIFAPAGDPVRSGLVPSLSSPGGNLTGVSLYASELNQKRLEVFKEALPGLQRVGALWNASNPAQAQYWIDLRGAAEHLGIEARPMMAKGLSDLEARFAATQGERLDGLIVSTDAEFDAGRKEIVRLAAEYRLPAMYEHRAFVEAGGLMSYGPNIDQLSYRAASYVDKILKGAKPADLPIEQPATFELIVNLRAARPLALAFPPTLLARADEVIE